MLISFLDITKNFNMKISGILHVGAHKCEELKDYLTFGLTKSKIIWVEANKEKYDYIKRNDNELIVYNEGKMSPAEAAYEAGYKTRARKAAAEMRNPKYFPLVVSYIGELRAEVREKYGITFEKHVTELAQIRNKALENKAWSAAVNAEVARGKAGGLYVDQKLVMTGNIDNLSADEIKDKLKKILDDNKEIINITPEDIESSTLELQEESNLDSHSQKN